MRHTQILQKVAKSFIYDALVINISDADEVKTKNGHALRFFINVLNRDFGDWVYLHRSKCRGIEYPNIHVNYNGIILNYPREAFKRTVLDLLPKEFMKKVPFKKT